MIVTVVNGLGELHRTTTKEMLPQVGNLVCFYGKWYRVVDVVWYLGETSRAEVRVEEIDG